MNMIQTISSGTSNPLVLCLLKIQCRNRLFYLNLNMLFMKSIKQVVFSIIILLASLYTSGQQPMMINANDRLLIGKNIEYFVDSSRSLTINDVLKQRFQQGQTNILNLGNIPHYVWMRFSAASAT